MAEALALLAPAKVNLTLEVLGRRDDGYHEVATVMQTIDLCDRVTLSGGEGIHLEVGGPQAGGTPADPAQDLAYRAAQALARKAGLVRPGVTVRVEKHIPAGMGLGGGSSDAAAVLRGLNRLWRLDLSNDTLAKVAAELGSDVPFFLHGGTALCTGRGEVVRPLPDHPPRALALFLPAATIPSKTSAMYAALGPAALGDGEATKEAVASIEAGRAVSRVVNTFDTVTALFGPALETAMAGCGSAGFEVHLCGSGPAFFALRPKEDLGADVMRTLKDMRIEVVGRSFLARADALRVEERDGG